MFGRIPSFVSSKHSGVHLFWLLSVISLHISQIVLLFSCQILLFTEGVIFCDLILVKLHYLLSYSSQEICTVKIVLRKLKVGWGSRLKVLWNWCPLNQLKICLKRGIEKLKSYQLRSCVTSFFCLCILYY